MFEFKYFLEKLEIINNKNLSFIKTRNSFNKLYDEYLKNQLKSDEIFNLLMPLERVFL